MRGRRLKRRGRGLRSLLTVLVLGTVVVGGLMVAAHLFDEELAHDGVLASQDRERPEPPASWSRIRVQVLNGAGVTGLAARATDLLREGGFDVVEVGNAGSFDHERTRVVSLTDGGQSARAVAGWLGVVEVEVERDSTRYADVTVILGQDWDPDRVSGEKEVAGEVTPVPWWDLRRFLDPKQDTHENP